MTDTVPGPAARYEPVVEVTTYPEAQRLVDRLSDRGFPVEHVRIVGVGIRSVEQVTGRRTNGRAALDGAAGGAWFGLLVGLLLALFVVDVQWLTVLLVAVAFGAAWGALFGFLAHWSTGGRRDFSSVTSFEASRYEIQVDAAHRAEAAHLLGDAATPPGPA
ncbi:general stress protein [Georgenia faecalis]|uniref:General stress protein n=1 Tax=Georgenia faecalis TaxID=2483799 RepID=A0ABV9D7R8_9MICO|nr:general stress protein [Georgenia faecalis]